MASITPKKVFEVKALSFTNANTFARSNIQYHGNIQSEIEHKKPQNKYSIPPIYFMLRHSFEIDAKHCTPCLLSCRKELHLISHGKKMENKFGTQMYDCQTSVLFCSIG